MYFSDVKNQHKLLDEIHRWVGTGFQYNTAGHAQPGISADCASFPLGVFRNLGLIPESFRSPQYVSVKGGKSEYNKLLESIERIPTLELVWAKENSNLPINQLAFGDLIICSSGTLVHHVLIYTGQDCAWHAWPKIGVSKTPIVNDKIIKHAQRIYRFTNAAE